MKDLLTAVLLFQLCISFPLEKISSRDIISDPNKLEEIISTTDKPYLIAFYENSDLNSNNSKFLNSFIMTVQKQFKDLPFYLYIGIVPERVESEYYLHYFTLPKLKLFFGAAHKTYDGGSSPNSIKAWLKRNIRIIQKQKRLKLKTA